ncbi:MAG: N-6 DNA methylase [Candidatus Hermodarchaeota archaeon]
MMDIPAQEVTHKLAGEKLFSALSKSQNEIIGAFQELGLTVWENRFIYPKKDSVFRDSIVDVQFEISNPEEFITSQLHVYDRIAREKSIEIELILLLTKKSLVLSDMTGKIYGSNFSQRSDGEWVLEGCLNWLNEEKTKIIEILTSLITVLDKPVIFNAETFASQYGRYSPLFIWALNLLLDYFNKNKVNLTTFFNAWAESFSYIYRNEDLTIALYLEHIYLTYLVKLTLLRKISPFLKLKKLTFNDLSSFLLERKIILFSNDFLNWMDQVCPLNNRFFIIIPDVDYDSSDIFRVIYQQLVSPSMRHGLGEFYTPPELARLIIDSNYQFGQGVLDPACGSGTFITELICFIKSSKKPLKEQIKAIENIYGIDYNPIAVLICKANILINNIELLETVEQLPLNIYLVNTLFPITFTTLNHPLYGPCQELRISAIHESLIIAERFLDPENKEIFANILSKVDQIINKNIQDREAFFVEIQNTLTPKETMLLKAKNRRGKTLHTNFFGEIASKFFSLNKNRLWTYLLFNLFGVPNPSNKIELVIGNPPWIVLNSIHSGIYQKQLKELVEKYDIKPDSQNITQMEISSIFISVTRDKYLTNNGKLFFIVSKGLLTGKQHNGTRKFTGLKDLEVWLFDKDVFRVPSICVSGIKTIQERKNLGDFKVIYRFYTCNRENNIWKFEYEKSEYYFPKIQNENIIGFESKSEKHRSLPYKKNPYYDQVFTGASIFPRNLLFIKFREIKEETIVFEPNMDLRSQKTWDFKPYDIAEVEKNYIYDIAKSTELVPFLHLASLKVFLPAERNNLQYNSSKIQPKARKHYDRLNQLYKEHQKRNAAIKELWERINYQNTLTAPRQLKPIKVVNNSSGKYLKSAIIRGESIIIDIKLYFCGFEENEEDEAYYLCAILNTPIIAKEARRFAGVGFGGKNVHMHKRVYNINFPKYNPMNPLHREISELGREMEEQTKRIAGNWKRNEFIKLKKKRRTYIETKSDEDIRWKPLSLQNLIYKNLDEDFKRLNDLVLKLFNEF